MSAVDTTREICIYGAAGPNNPMYWQRKITVDADNTCGELFGPVFEQYKVVFIWSMKAVPLTGGIPHVNLTREDNLLSVLRSLKLKNEVIDIYAE
jgi:hypothetical protein